MKMQSGTAPVISCISSSQKTEELQQYTAIPLEVIYPKEFKTRQTFNHPCSRSIHTMQCYSISKIERKLNT